MEVLIVCETNQKFCIGFPNDSEESSEAVLCEINNEESQKFKLEGTEIKNVKSGLSLDICGGEKAGAQIIQYKANGGDNQKWYWHKDCSIRSENGFCLEVQDSKFEAGTKIVSAEAKGTDNQKWRIVEAKK